MHLRSKLLDIFLSLYYWSKTWLKVDFFEGKMGLFSHKIDIYVIALLLLF